MFRTTLGDVEVKIGHESVLSRCFLGIGRISITPTLFSLLGDATGLWMKCEGWSKYSSFSFEYCRVLLPQIIDVDGIMAPFHDKTCVSVISTAFQLTAPSFLNLA